MSANPACAYCTWTRREGAAGHHLSSRPERRGVNADMTKHSVYAALDARRGGVGLARYSACYACLLPQYVCDRFSWDGKNRCTFDAKARCPYDELPTDIYVVAVLWDRQATATAHHLLRCPGEVPCGEHLLDGEFGRWARTKKKIAVNREVCGLALFIAALKARKVLLQAGRHSLSGLLSNKKVELNSTFSVVKVSVPGPHSEDILPFPTHKSSTTDMYYPPRLVRLAY